MATQFRLKFNLWVLVDLFLYETFKTHYYIFDIVDNPSLIKEGFIIYELELKAMFITFMTCRASLCD